MKSIYCILFLITLSTTLMAQSLDHYQWRNRLVLLFAPNGEDVQLQKQLDLFENEKAAFEERKLKIIQITDHTIAEDNVVQYSKDNFFFKKYKIPQEEFTILLIGLDGGEKLRKTAILNPQDLYVLIDRMPMRQYELRDKKN